MKPFDDILWNTNVIETVAKLPRKRSNNRPKLEVKWRVYFATWAKSVIA